MSDPDQAVPYNPLDEANLVRSVVEEFLRSPIHPLPPTERFVGCGIYAIYYTGPFGAYAPIAKANAEGFQKPIYVGKAVPPGGRVGGLKRTVATATLFLRLRKHSRSIKATRNLDLNDFHCRFRTVTPLWVPLAESLLIDRFRPLWNSSELSGFGINAPGRGRTGQKRSLWDTVHSGRVEGAHQQSNDLTAEQILATVADVLTQKRQVTYEPGEE